MSFSTRWVREAIPASDGMVPVNLFPLSSRISSALRKDIKGVKVPNKPLSVNACDSSRAVTRDANTGATAYIAAMDQ